MNKPPAESGDLPPERDSDLDGGGRSDRRDWERQFAEVESGLRCFLTGKLPQHADIDDCLQAVYVSMLKNRSPIPAAARRAWLFRVAANEAANWWRTKAVTDRVMEKHANSNYTVETGPPDAIESEETLQRLTDAVDKLPDNAKQIVQLRLHQAMTFQAIADQLQIPLGTVLTRMRRAMQRLRDELESED